MLALPSRNTCGHMIYNSLHYLTFKKGLIS
nr:MAG TPA: hypothetical protein [Bacteriophage sp.]DAW42554.1 MAG TPA: hypothetical protein [Bacteriophage sp.]